MDFSLTDEQQLVIDTTRQFVEQELFPHEAEVVAEGTPSTALGAPRQGIARRSEWRHAQSSQTRCGRQTTTLRKTGWPVQSSQAQRSGWTITM